MQGAEACREQMFTQGTQAAQRVAQAAVGLQPAVPVSQNGTLDEPVSDTLKRDVYRCCLAALG